MENKDREDLEKYQHLNNVLHDTLNRLLELQKSNDTETSHIFADEAICNLLSALGYDGIVKEYEKVNKWYS